MVEIVFLVALAGATLLVSLLIIGARNLSRRLMRQTASASRKNHQTPQQHEAPSTAFMSPSYPPVQRQNLDAQSGRIADVAAMILGREAAPPRSIVKVSERVTQGTKPVADPTCDYTSDVRESRIGSALNAMYDTLKEDLGKRLTEYTASLHHPLNLETSPDGIDDEYESLGHSLVFDDEEPPRYNLRPGIPAKRVMDIGIARRTGTRELVQFVLRWFPEIRFTVIHTDDIFEFADQVDVVREELGVLFD